MSQSVTAFSPGHISGYFRKVSGSSPATTGSVGAGIVISEGVFATVERADHTAIAVFRYGDGGQAVRVADDSPPLRSALEEIGVDVAVITRCRLPIGAGFGLSAAALLATLTAADRLFHLGLGEREVAHVAHATEVRHSTGLGDVVSCRGGGMVVRTVAGIDAPVRRLTGIAEPVYAMSFGPIHTPSVLGSPEQMARVAAAFPAGEPATLSEFFARARAFADRSGLVTGRVKKVLSACDAAGVMASMTMLGEGVFACGDQAPPVLSRFGGTYGMTVAREGPVVVEER